MLINSHPQPAGGPDLPRAYRVHKFPAHPSRARVRVAKLLIPLASLLVRCSFLRCILLRFSCFFFCCTFLMISLVFVSASCNSGRLFFYVQFCAISRCSCHIRKPQFPPLRAPARIVSINCLLPDALYPDHTVFHGFPTASEPDKKITGPGSAVHRARPYISPSPEEEQEHHPGQLSLSVDMLQLPLCFSVHPESKRFSSYQDIQYSNRPPLLCVKVRFCDRNIFPFA